MKRAIQTLSPQPCLDFWARSFPSNGTSFNKKSSFTSLSSAIFCSSCFSVSSSSSLPSMLPHSPSTRRKSNHHPHVHSNHTHFRSSFTDHTHSQDSLKATPNPEPLQEPHPLPGLFNSHTPSQGSFRIRIHF